MILHQNTACRHGARIDLLNNEGFDFSFKLRIISKSPRSNKARVDNVKVALLYLLCIIGNAFCRSLLNVFVCGDGKEAVGLVCGDHNNIVNRAEILEMGFDGGIMGRCCLVADRCVEAADKSLFELGKKELSLLIRLRFRRSPFGPETGAKANVIIIVVVIVR